MIDSHSHLFAEEFVNDLDECLTRCKQRNVNKIILVGFSEETNNKAYQLSLEHDIFYPTAGVHPECVAEEDVDKQLNSLYEFVKTHKIYAIGECGLDYHYVSDNKEKQKEVFIKQIELAIKLDLPIIVHSRDASFDTLEIIKKYKGKLKGVMHCFSGSKETALEYIKLGFYIGIGGAVTFKNAKEPKEVVKAIPIDKLLVETDCPYITPVPKRGTRNESSYVAYTLEYIADLLQMKKEELDEITTNNTMKLFQLERE